MRWALAGPAASRRGFSLIELIVVLAVLAVLAAISVGTYQQTNERARVRALDSSLTNFARAHTQALMYEDMSSRDAAEQVLSTLADGSVIVLGIFEVGELGDGPVEGALGGPNGEAVVLAAGTQSSATSYVVTARFAQDSSLCRQTVMPAASTPADCGDTPPDPAGDGPGDETTTTEPPGTTSTTQPTAPTTTVPSAPTTTVPAVARSFSVMVHPVDNRIYWWHSFWDGSGGMGEWVAAFSFSNMWIRHQYLDLLVTRTHSNGTISTETVTGFYVPGGGGAPSRSWSNEIGVAFAVPHGITRVEVKVTRVVTSDEMWQPMESTPMSGVSGEASMDWPSLPI